MVHSLDSFWKVNNSLSRWGGEGGKGETENLRRDRRLEDVIFPRPAIVCACFPKILCPLYQPRSWPKVRLGVVASLIIRLLDSIFIDFHSCSMFSSSLGFREHVTFACSSWAASSSSARVQKGKSHFLPCLKMQLVKGDGFDKNLLEFQDCWCF